MPWPGTWGLGFACGRELGTWGQQLGHVTSCLEPAIWGLGLRGLEPGAGSLGLGPETCDLDSGTWALDLEFGAWGLLPYEWILGSARIEKVHSESKDMIIVLVKTMLLKIMRRVVP